MAVLSLALAAVRPARTADRGGAVPVRPATRLLSALAVPRQVFLDPLSPDDEEADRDLRRGLRDAAPETLRAFVVLAVTVQVGLFAAALGVMLAAFRGQRALGGALAAGGLAVLGLSVVLYRRYRS